MTVVCTHYHIEKIEINLFLESLTRDEERKQLKGVLNMLPEAIIITTDLPTA